MIYWHRMTFVILITSPIGWIFRLKSHLSVRRYKDASFYMSYWKPKNRNFWWGKKCCKILWLKNEEYWRFFILVPMSNKIDVRYTDNLEQVKPIWAIIKERYLHFSFRLQKTLHLIYFLNSIDHNTRVCETWT